MMNNWQEIRNWRRLRRNELRSRRLEIPLAERTRTRAIISDLVRARVPELTQACIGFCWPFGGEINLLKLVRESIALGATAALPCVVEKNQPLEFWAWRPGMEMARGIWNIPVPAERTIVRPTVVLVPLVGFDDAGYRLGYGGGYFDRTLATLDSPPLTIGIGYEFARLNTIYPQPHDIPLDAIVTETGCTVFRPCGWLQDQSPTAPAEDPSRSEPTPYASPPCYLHEVDPQYLGYMSAADLIELLNQLLEGERAGARDVSEIANGTAGETDRAILHNIAKDEGYFCQMLTRHIVDLGGVPSSKTGAFYEKLIAQSRVDECLDQLNRGQGWVVRTLREALPKISADGLARDLQHMLDVHERNIQKCLEIG